MSTTSDPGKDVISSGAGLAAAVVAESGTELGEVTTVRARGYWEQVWRRFRRDRVAIGGGVFIIFLFLVAFVGAPIAKHFLGHGPNDLFAGGLDDKLLPVGPLSYISTPRTPARPATTGRRSSSSGADSQLGRDEFLRLLYGAQTSLEVAIGATLLEHDRRRADGLDRRLLRRLDRHARLAPDRDRRWRSRSCSSSIALASTVGDRLNKVTLRRFLGPGVVTLVLVFGFFGWFYPARIVRAQVLSLREKEFIEAARMVGASDWRIIRSHLLPHLVAPIIVLSTIMVAAVHPRRGRPLVPRPRHQAADGELGQPARDGAGLLPDPAVADGLAGPRRAARRRSPSTCSATGCATRSTRARTGTD